MLYTGTPRATTQSSHIEDTFSKFLVTRTTKLSKIPTITTSFQTNVICQRILQSQFSKTKKKMLKACVGRNSQDNHSACPPYGHLFQWKVHGCSHVCVCDCNCRFEKNGQLLITLKKYSFSSLKEIYNKLRSKLNRHIPL